MESSQTSGKGLWVERARRRSTEGSQRTVGSRCYEVDHGRNGGVTSTGQGGRRVK